MNSSLRLMLRDILEGPIGIWDATPQPEGRVTSEVETPAWIATVSDRDLYEHKITPDQVGEFYQWLHDIKGTPLERTLRVGMRLERELAKGIRCAVCGMTTEQAGAANYDCARGC